MERFFEGMSNETKITLVTLILTNMVTIVLAIIGFYQKKNEQANQQKLIQEERQQSRINSDRDMYIKTIQDFAYVAGNIVTIIESKIGPSTKKKQDLNPLLNFDEVYYKFYILLTDEADRKILQKFQYQVRSLAGLPDPEGVAVWDEAEEFDKYQQSQAEGYIEPPREIYNKLEECLSICRKLIKEKMSLVLND